MGISKRVQIERCWVLALRLCLNLIFRAIFALAWKVWDEYVILTIFLKIAASSISLRLPNGSKLAVRPNFYENANVWEQWQH